MGKNRVIQELTNILTQSLRHKIGSIVNPNELYTEKYMKDAEILFDKAERVSKLDNWNINDKIKIGEELKRKLKLELESKEFLNERKFDIMDEEIDKALKSLNLNS